MFGSKKRKEEKRERKEARKAEKRERREKRRKESTWIEQILFDQEYYAEHRDED